jgi:hypothetical protein
MTTQAPINRWTTAVLTILAMTAIAPIAQAAEVQTVPIVFSGGHDTDRRDHGRPVVLIAAALGVPAETFRKAFSGVHPAQGRGPTPEEAQRNKEALLNVLAPYGITNDRLDTVSNYYRYRPESGRLWRNRPAEGVAIIRNGKVLDLKITNPGSGYSSSPTVSVPGYVLDSVVVKVKYTTRFETNGSISSVN